MQIITNSRRNSFNDCSRKHYLRYEEGFAPVKTGEALRFGSLMHGALEVWWKGEKETRLAEAIAWLDKQYEADWNAYDIEKARQLIRGYDARWQGQDLVAVENGIEREFRAPLINPDTKAESRTFQLSGKIDALARDASGQLYIVEHKTTSEDISPESDYWSVLSIDGQVSGYYVGAQVIGFDTAGCVYDVIKKPDLRPGMATPIESRKYTKDGRLYAAQREHDESVADFGDRLAADIAQRPEHYFQRRPVARLTEDLVDYYYDMWACAREIRESQLACRWPRNPQACKRFGLCEYFPVCTKQAEIGDESMYVRLENKYPELSIETVTGVVAELEPALV